MNAMKVITERLINYVIKESEELNRPVFLGQMVECIHAAAPVPRRF